MAITKRTRKQIESNILNNANNMQKCGLEIGRDLIEIRDEHLWADNYDSFDKYLKSECFRLIGHEFNHAQRLIRCVKIESKLPANNSILGDTILKPKHMDEIGRLAPTVGKKSGGAGVSKNYDALKKSDVNRVLKRAAEINELKSTSQVVSVASIRQAVDEDLGIDRAAEAKASRAEVKQMRDEHNELANYIRRLISQLKSAASNFSKVPGNGWEVLETEHPLLAEKLAEECDGLAELLRS